MTESDAISRVQALRMSCSTPTCGSHLAGRNYPRITLWSAFIIKGKGNRQRSFFALFRSKTVTCKVFSHLSRCWCVAAGKRRAVRHFRWGMLRQDDECCPTQHFCGREICYPSLLIVQHSVKHLLTSATYPSHPGFLLRRVRFSCQDTTFRLIGKTHLVFESAPVSAQEAQLIDSLDL